MKSSPESRRRSAGITLALLLSGLLAWGSFALGLLLRARVPSFDGGPLCAGLLVLLALLSLMGHVAGKRYLARRMAVPISEREQASERIRAAAEADPEGVLDKLRGCSVLPALLASLYCLIAIGIAAAGGAAGRGSPLLRALAPVVTFGLLFCGPFDMLLVRRPSPPHDEYTLPPEEFPVLYGAARRAVDALGLKETVLISTMSGGSISADRARGTCRVSISARFLSVATEGELYQSFLRILSLYAEPSLRRVFFRYLRIRRLLGDADVRPRFLYGAFLSPAAAVHEWESIPYLSAFFFAMSRCAARWTLEKGDALQALGALAKQEAVRFFDFESVNYAAVPYLAAPEPPADFERKRCELFRRVTSERFAVWQSLLDRELPSFQSGLPLFREERAYLRLEGVRVELTFPDPDSPYGREAAAAIARVDRDLLRLNAPDYAEARAQNYLSDLAIVEAYERSDRTQPTAELSPVINAYASLNRFAEAERLCDDILSRERNPFAQAHALFFKGQMLTRRLDEDGIDYLYRAMDINKNYMRGGLDRIGTLCCMMGLETAYENYRRRFAVMIEAHSENLELASSLSSADRLEPETGLGDMLPEILSYMRGASDGCVSEIYLVRKVISDDFFSSVFVIRFTGGSSGEQRQHAYEAIFNYLDSFRVDWQFSLFVFDRKTERAVRRVKDSLVWSLRRRTC